ncbi:MAG: DUF4492 domain-containing protein [Flavobacteriales bacterium]|nr:DUF4492 domain-containing protein [Flavobacteriales bacterium]
MIVKELVTRVAYFYFSLYRNGFRSMSKQSKTLWIIAVIKLVIMFGILKVFFFGNYLDSKYDTEKEKIEHIHKELTEIKK